MKSADDVIAIGIKQIVAQGKECGYVTYDELNAALPADRVSSEQIEGVMAMLTELGINVVEAGCRVRPAKGKIDHAALTREIIERYPNILAALAK